MRVNNNKYMAEHPRFNVCQSFWVMLYGSFQFEVSVFGDIQVPVAHSLHKVIGAVFF